MNTRYNNLYKSLLLSFSLVTGTLFFLTSAQAQTGMSKQEKKAAQQAVIKNIVDSQNYVFVAQSALPLAGRTRQLTSEYELKVSADLIDSYLPYFGRAYVAPMDPSKSPLQFKSKDFTYTLNARKKGGWDATIKPKDNPEVQQMTISISVDGYASVQVTSTNRSPISFNGYIRARNNNKKN